MDKNRLDKKGLASFLAITFVLTISVAIFMFKKNLSLSSGNDLFTAQIIMVSVMFIPAVATILVKKFISHEDWQSAGLKRGAFKYYKKVWLTIPFCFLLIYFLTYALGYWPDFSLQAFAQANGLEIPPYPHLAILGIFIITLFITPFVNSLAGFGEELGWRGYLLPKLMPLGVKKALWIHGIIWGLWHTPFVVLLGFGGYTNTMWGALFFLILVTFIGIYFGYLRLVSGSTLVAAWAHGVLNAQSYGIWVIIFPQVNRFLAGFSGLVGLLVFGALAWYSLKDVEKIDYNKASLLNN